MLRCLQFSFAPALGDHRFRFLSLSPSFAPLSALGSYAQLRLQAKTPTIAQLSPRGPSKLKGTAAFFRSRATRSGPARGG